MNLVEKILARASGNPEVTPGEIIEARIDAAMVHDLTGPLVIDSFQRMEAVDVWDSERIIIILDHLVPASSVEAADLHKKLREFAKEKGIRNFYEVGRGGVCHQVMVEKGHAGPGEVILGADSHTCTYGALGAFATGIGSTEMAAVLATGKLWFRVPRALRINVGGKFGKFVTPKDLILRIIGDLGSDGATYKGIEFTGPTISDMSIDGRMTLCNMAVEAGAKVGVIDPDEKTLDYVKERAKRPHTPLRSDREAAYDKALEVNVTGLAPQVSCPPSVDDVKSVSDLDSIEIDQAFLGSCTNGRMDDLRLAAAIMRGRKVGNGVRLIVVPASQEIYFQALREGLIETFMQSGAFIASSTCGPCLGGHVGLLASGEVCISSSNRNFVGRMGSPGAKVYLASPATVAASAVTGKISDPRSMEVYR